MMNDPATLRALRATPVLVPLPIPLKTASGMIAASPLVLVDLETDTGCTGHAYLFVYSPLALRPVVEIINALGSELVGSAVAPAELLLNLSHKFRLLGTAGLLGMALAGLEIAAWDVVAKLAGLPLYQLLGGLRKPLKAYARLGMDGIDVGQRLVGEARARVSGGEDQTRLSHAGGRPAGGARNPGGAGP